MVKVLENQDVCLTASRTDKLVDACVAFNVNGNFCSDRRKIC